MEKNETFILDGRSRIASIRVGDSFPNDIDAEYYVLEDHLGSGMLRLKATAGGTVIDREEYYPFGDSSLRTWTKKRYQYVGKEKDSESGLYYYGARYYAAWTCRFISVDPLAAKYAHLNPYNNAGNKVINQKDIDGLQGENEGQSESGGNTNGYSTNDQGDSTYTGAFVNNETGEVLHGTFTNEQAKAANISILITEGSEAFSNEEDAFSEAKNAGLGLMTQLIGKSVQQKLESNKLLKDEQESKSPNKRRYKNVKTGKTSIKTLTKTKKSGIGYKTPANQYSKPIDDFTPKQLRKLKYLKGAAKAMNIANNYSSFAEMIVTGNPFALDPTGITAITDEMWNRQMEEWQSDFIHDLPFEKVKGLFQDDSEYGARYYKGYYMRAVSSEVLLAIQAGLITRTDEISEYRTNNGIDSMPEHTVIFRSAGMIDYPVRYFINQK